jgi:hypothetical protein
MQDALSQQFDKSLNPACNPVGWLTELTWQQLTTHLTSTQTSICPSMLANVDQGGRMRTTLYQQQHHFARQAPAICAALLSSMKTLRKKLPSKTQNAAMARKNFLWTDKKASPHGRAWTAKTHAR